MARELILSIDSIENIPSGETREILIEVKKGFHPRVLLVPGTISSSFLIEDIKIGDSSQLMAPLLAEIFTPASNNIELMFDEASPGEVITVIVLNMSGAPLRFGGALFGPPLTLKHDEPSGD